MLVVELSEDLQDEVVQRALRGDIAGALELTTLEHIASCYCAYHAARVDRAADSPALDDETNWWAVMFAFDVCRDPEAAKRFLLALVDAPGADDVALVIGAGPFEDVLGFGDDDLDWIEEHAATSEVFRAALRNMRIPREIPEAVHIRVHRAAGHRPERWGKYNP